MASWEPTATKLPIYGQRGVSSDDWKFIINEIYTRLNALKVNNFGNLAPAADTGELWFDNKVGENRLKVKTPAGWTALIFEGSLGNVAYKNTGNQAGNVPELLADNKLPVLDGSNLTHINADKLANSLASYESMPNSIPVSDNNGVINSNYFPESIKRHEMTSGPTSNRPMNPVEGFIYYDTTLGAPVWYTGNSWSNVIITSYLLEMDASGDLMPTP